MRVKKKKPHRKRKTVLMCRVKKQRHNRVYRANRDTLNVGTLNDVLVVPDGDLGYVRTLRRGPLLLLLTLLLLLVVNVVILGVVHATGGGGVVSVGRRPSVRRLLLLLLRTAVALGRQVVTVRRRRRIVGRSSLGRRYRIVMSRRRLL